MCCSRLIDINDDVIMLVMMMYNVNDGDDGNVMDDDDSHDNVFHGDCNNDGYDIFLIYL